MKNKLYILRGAFATIAGMKVHFLNKSVVVVLGAGVVAIGGMFYGWQQATVAEEFLCPVYRFECIPRVKHLALERHMVPCTKAPFQKLPKPALEGHTWQTLAEKGIYAPFGGLEHSCTLKYGTATLKTSIENLGDVRSKFSCNSKQLYTLRTDWWFDAHHAVKGLNLSHCSGATQQTITEVKPYPYIEYAPKQPDGYVGVTLNGKEKWYYIYINPDASIKLKKNSTLPAETIKAPLTNADVYE